jgi:hypothetical protein
MWDERGSVLPSPASGRSSRTREISNGKIYIHNEAAGATNPAGQEITVEIEDGEGFLPRKSSHKVPYKRVLVVEPVNSDAKFKVKSKLHGFKSAEFQNRSHQLNWRTDYVITEKDDFYGFDVTEVTRRTSLG